MISEAPLRRRALAFGIAGVVCAVGLGVALMTPATPPPTPLPDVHPTASLASTHPIWSNAPGTQVESSELPESEIESQLSAQSSDPRAFVIAEVLAGRLGTDLAALRDLSAQVASRNGDVVLVQVDGTTDAGPHSVSALLVHTEDGWIVRESYDSEL